MKEITLYQIGHVTSTLIKKITLALILLICMSSSTLLAQTSIVQLQEAAIINVAYPPANEFMQFPRAFGFDIKTADGDAARQILLNWAKNRDAANVQSVFAHKMSYNGGSTYGSEVFNLPSLNFGNAMKKRDGKIICLPFLVKDDSVPPKHLFKFTYHISTDNGGTFDSLTNGTVNFGTLGVNWMRIDRGMFETNDGLFVPAYASYPIYGGITRCILLNSVDQGATWKLHGEITHPDTDPGAYDEVTVSICANGDWLSVFRTGQFTPLKYARSTNKGVTWGPAAPLPGLPTTSQANVDDFNESVDPFLQMMPNGILVLTYGRPNSHLAFSLDGNGTNWTYLATSFLEVPGAVSPTTLGFQSTNYTTLVPTGYNKFVYYGDRGANWTYLDASGNHVEHPTPVPYRIWQKSMEIITNRQNRIDLKQKYLTIGLQLCLQQRLTIPTRHTLKQGHWELLMVVLITGAPQLATIVEFTNWIFKKLITLTPWG